MLGALLLVDGCFNDRLREHCISMSREILNRCNSTLDLFPCFQSCILTLAELGKFSIALQTLDGDSAKILPINPPRDCDKINDYKILKIVHAL